MSAGRNDNQARWLRGGAMGPALALGFGVSILVLVYGIYFYPQGARSYGHEIGYNRAMFGAPLAQPIPFSHRLHVTDKEIDCYYCHPYAERSINAGLPSVEKCLGCHDYIIPDHEEIKKLKAYHKSGAPLPWKRVYYNPDHVYFPHFRHLAKDLKCQQCHGEVEQVDRLHQVTFYMGFCIDCHQKLEASLECVACHQ
jgi:hypothetical protein